MSAPKLPVLSTAKLVSSTVMVGSVPLGVPRCGGVAGSAASRRYSIRAYDERDWLIDSEVGPGSDLKKLIERFFESEAVRYLHLHHAGHGCYACRVDRA